MRKNIAVPTVLAAIAVCLLLAAGPDLGAPDFTAKHVTAESLTIKAPGSKSSVSILARRDATGIWVSSGKGAESVGLVVQPGVEPYFVVYGQKAGYPNLAITGDLLQFGTGSSDPDSVRQLSFSDILKAAPKNGK